MCFCSRVGTNRFQTSQKRSQESHVTKCAEHMNTLVNRPETCNGGVHVAWKSPPLPPSLSPADSADLGHVLAFRVPSSTQDRQRVSDARLDLSENSP